jgi:phosphatidylserine/phosphatidylglycerophosphate/cardiolipin synthase-like enzyme
VPVTGRPLVALTLKLTLAIPLVWLAGCGLGPPDVGPARAGRPITLIVEPDAGPAAIVSLVAAARTSVWMEMYLLTDARAIGALADRARAGCDVRVILEPSPYLSEGANQSAFDALAAAGAGCAGRHRASPTPTRRR